MSDIRSDHNKNNKNITVKHTVHKKGFEIGASLHLGKSEENNNNHDDDMPSSVHNSSASRLNTILTKFGHFFDGSRHSHIYKTEEKVEQTSDSKYTEDEYTDMANLLNTVLAIQEGADINAVAQCNSRINNLIQTIQQQDSSDGKIITDGENYPFPINSSIDLQDNSNNLIGDNQTPIHGY